MGMGWFKCWNQPVEDGEIFVPAWGWVGSAKKNNDFDLFNDFSSPLGDGLVLLDFIVTARMTKFSSPSGDGLVLSNLINK
mgnify:CR=1 FL=1